MDDLETDDLDLDDIEEDFKEVESE